MQRLLNYSHEGIACIVMASGLSIRYGKNKLLEPLGDKPVLLHVTDVALEAGLKPLVVTRSADVMRLLENNGIPVVLHDKPLKSDTMHEGLLVLSNETHESSLADTDASHERLPLPKQDWDGYLFMQGDQPLVSPESLRRMIDKFRENPDRAVRLGFGDIVASPVLFPGCCREALLAYQGDRGGAEVLREGRIPIEVVQASAEWELWDVDTPEKIERVREVEQFRGDL